MHNAENTDDEAPPSFFTRVSNEGKALLDTTVGRTSMFLLNLTLAIFSTVTAILAFTSFTAATGNLDNLISNWERPPISGIYLSNTSTCPSGYDLMSTPKWPGTSSSACACASGAYSSISLEFEYSSGSSCDANQTNAGCLSQPTWDSINLNEWRGRYICLQKTGEAQLKSSKEARPIPKRSGVCESGYQACGDSTYDKHRTVCIPDEYDCPVTGALADTSLPSGYSDNYTMTTDDGTNWYIRFQAQDEMPINDVELVLYSTTQKRGHCFRSASGQFANQENYDGRASSDSYSNNYPSKCAQVDTRWETLDYQSETDYLYANFIIDEPLCEGSSEVDYISTGTQCSASPFTDTDCMLYGYSSTSLSNNGCSSSDSTCKNVYYQSSCGDLSRWATQASEKWAVQFRREIYWKSDCEASIVDIKGVQTPIESISTALGWNMAFNIIGNLINGVILNYWVWRVSLQLVSEHTRAKMTEHLKDSKNPADVEEYNVAHAAMEHHEATKEKIEHHEKWLALTLSIIQFIPAIVAIVMFEKIEGTIARAVNGDCADSNDKRTLETLEDLDEEMAASIDSLWSQIAFDLLSIFMAIAMTIMAHMQKSKEAKKAKKAQEVEMKQTGSTQLSPLTNPTMVQGHVITPEKTQEERGDRPYGGGSSLDRPTPQVVQGQATPPTPTTVVIQGRIV